ncbi:MAG: hypothetical protein Q9176_007990 [Flavoplaca citrina]
MLRFVERDVDGFWRDETSKFNAALENDGHAGAQITNSCKAISIEDTSPIANLYSMYCFADLDPHTTSDSRILAYFQFELTVSGNLTVNYTTTSLSNTFGRPEYFSNTSSELILIPQASELERIPMWFKDSTSKAPVGSLPSPSSPFPYHRLATTYGGASDQVYMYHQASDSVLIEESRLRNLGFRLHRESRVCRVDKLANTTAFPEWNTFNPSATITSQPFNATIPPEEQDFLNADAKFTYAVVLDPSNVGEDGQPVRTPSMEQVSDLSTPEHPSDYVPRDIVDNDGSFYPDLSMVYRIALITDGDIVAQGLYTERFNEIIDLVEGCGVLYRQCEPLTQVIKDVYEGLLQDRFEDWADGLEVESEGMVGEGYGQENGKRRGGDGCVEKSEGRCVVCRRD